MVRNFLSGVLKPASSLPFQASFSASPRGVGGGGQRQRDRGEQQAASFLHGDSSGYDFIEA
jgi:hypothetical protein